MKTSIYSRHRYHPDTIKRAVWLYFRFNLSFRDVEELMIERGVDVSYETIRRWVDKFGSTYAKRIESIGERPPPVWHLDAHLKKYSPKVQVSSRYRMEFSHGTSSRLGAHPGKNDGWFS